MMIMVQYLNPFAKSRQLPRNIPGDLSGSAEISRMLRVNQAGEYGAKRIYQGQIDLLGASDKKELIIHMAEQEQEHLNYFDAAIIENGSRPSALSPLWHVAGYALGALPSLLGTRAAMAVTVAVEEVIDAHYEQQVKRLKQRGDYAELQAAILKFQADEIEHRNTGLANEAEQAPAFPLLHCIIRQTSKTAIFIAERI